MDVYLEDHQTPSPALIFVLKQENVFEICLKALIPNFIITTLKWNITTSIDIMRIIKILSAPMHDNKFPLQPHFSKIKSYTGVYSIRIGFNRTTLFIYRYKKNLIPAKFWDKASLDGSFLLS